MDPQAALEGARMAADSLAQLLDVDDLDAGTAEHDEAVQGTAGDLLTNFRSLDDWLSQGGFKPVEWRNQDDEQLYEKCRFCHLFVEPNEAYVPGENIATHVHLARGDDADEKLDADHDPTPSGLRATLDTWRVFGPWQMRERFVVLP